MRRVSVIVLSVLCVMGVSVPLWAQSSSGEDCDLTASIDTYLSAGQGALSSGENSTAIEAFTCAVQIDFNSVDGYSGRAEAYVNLEQYAEARSDLYSVLAIGRERQTAVTAEATLDVELPAVDEVPVVARLEQIEAQYTPSILDGFTPSPTDQFGISFPADQFTDVSQPATVENITLVNDTGIFTPDGMVLDNRDVLITLDLGNPQVIAGMPIDSSLLVVAQGLLSLNGEDVTPLTRMSTPNFSGYTFSLVDNRNNYVRVLTFDIDPSGEGVLILNIRMMTASNDDLEANLPILLEIADSFELYASLTTQSGGGDAGAFVNSGDGFTLALPGGWLAEAMSVNGRDSIVVTTGAAYTPDSLPVAGAPYAIVNYGSASALLNVAEGSLDPETAPVQVLQAITGITNGARALPYEGFNAALAFTSDGTMDNFVFAVMLDNDFYVLANMFTATGSDGDFFDALMTTIIGVGFSN